MDRERQTRWLALLAITAVGLYLCWAMLAPFFSIVMTAIVLVIVFAPAHAWLRRKLRKPVLAALAATLLVLVTTIGPLVGVGFGVTAQIPAAADALWNGWQAARERFEHSELLQRQLHRADVQQYLNSDQFRESVSRAGQAVMRGTVTVLGGVAGFLFASVAVVFTAYYLFRDGERLVGAITESLPLDHSQSERLLTRVQEVIQASVYGVLVIAAIQGILGGLMFWILGLTAPLAWGVVMTLLSIIPMLGAFLIWAPAAAYLAISGEIVKAVVLAVWGAAVVGTVDNFLRPKLVGHRTQMHELTVFFSVLGGLHLFGLLGFLLGPVILATTMGLLQALRLVPKDGEEAAASQPSQANAPEPPNNPPAEP